jgi:hypothetical protein
LAVRLCSSAFFSAFLDVLLILSGLFAFIIIMEFGGI